MENDFLATKNFVPQLKSHFLSFSEAIMNFLAWDKIFCLGQKCFFQDKHYFVRYEKYFVRGKKYFVRGKKYFVRADGQGIRLLNKKQIKMSFSIDLDWEHPLLAQLR